MQSWRSRCVLPVAQQRLQKAAVGSCQLAALPHFGQKLCINKHNWLSRMGNKIVTFTEQQLDDYQDCTFFTRKEILRVHKRFRELRPDLVPRQMTEGQASSVKVPRECIEKMPELRENPFRRRICEAFSRDGLGNLSFEDFLDALSVFSEQAPRDIKVFYAFKIYVTDLIDIQESG
ncbi:calcium and integrin-binding family member 2 isoform X2 [Drosophila montana]|uniref:calcium and integrin-binding family member 2 isoform X2 n=1 Tax=Drosophila montana TaxID=40370 RepID=UPI00313CC607